MHRIDRTAISLGLLAATLLSCPATAAPPEEALTAWLQEQVDTGKFRSVSSAYVVPDGVRMFVGGGGSSISAQSPYQIGSITKVFTNLLLAEMVEAGKVRHDTTIGELLGEGFAPANAALADRTLLDLATHRSGLPRLPVNLDQGDGTDPYAAYGEQELLQGLTVARAGQPLPEHYAYSNFGVGLLGYLLGRADGRGYTVALRERVLKPLGLEGTGFEPTRTPAPGWVGGKEVAPWTFQETTAGAGALWGTAVDLAQLAQVYLDLRDSGLKHALADDLKVVAEGPEAAVTRVWHVAPAEGGPIFWHNGRTAGYGSFVGFRPDIEEAVAILFTGDGDATGFALDLLGREPADEAGSGRGDAPDATVIGTYRLTPTFKLRIFSEKGVLMTQATAQPALRLHAAGDDWYTLGEADASLHFLREGDTVTGVDLVQSGRTQRAERVADDEAEPEAIQLDARDLEAYVGEYTLAPGAVFTVRVTAGQLEAQLTGQPSLPVYPREKDVFFYKVVPAELHFERDGQGNVVALVLHQGGAEQRAARASASEVRAEPEVNQLDARALEAYVGEYELAPGAVFTVRVTDGQLEAQLTGQPFFPVYPREADAFFYKVVPAELHFERDGQGNVVALVLHQGGAEQRAARKGP